jgi:hypothetical protein
MASQDEVKGEGFEVVGHETPPRPGEAGAEPPPPQDAAEGLPSLDVYAVLRVCVAQLAGVAWQMMGLQPDPFTNTLRKDIAQARVAIDAAAALVEQLRPNLKGQEARDFDSLLTDLRLNFVTHAGEQAQ